MADTTRIPIMLSGISGILNSHMSNTMTIGVLKHFLSVVEDDEIRAALQRTADLSNQYIEELTSIFNKEFEF